MVNPVIGTRRRPIGRRLFGASRSSAGVLRCLVVGSLMAMLAATQPLAAATTQRTDVGYDDLVAALGDRLPTGNGVPIAQIEATETQNNQPVAGRYLPLFTFPAFGETTDPPTAGITFDDVTGTGNGLTNSSDHATGVVGAQFYGNDSSLAPGVTEVAVYEADNWLNNVLRMSGRRTPTQGGRDFRVQNFSWAGAYPNSNDNVQALERFDYLIDTDNITAVVGINGSGAVPTLLAHSYNSIAVGRTTGDNSTDLTQSFYGAGRTKPEIVAPYSTPSAATAFVSSAATLLHDGATQLPTVAHRNDAAQSEVVKATLLAGATKGEFASWSRTSLSPLDNQFGAGELNVYNSYVIQSGGQFEGSTTEPTTAAGADGWDYGNATDGVPLYYNITIPENSYAEELSVVLTWNAEVTDSNAGSVFTGEVDLANMDLRLYDSTNAFLDTLLDLSISDVSNVEHLYLTSLAAGTYTLEVTSDTDRDFGLAWRAETLSLEPSGDLNADGSIDGADFLDWQRNLGTLTGASVGDADGDGDVDAADLAIYESAATLPVVALTATAIPEPTTLLLALLGFGFVAYLRLRGNLPRRPLTASR